jgi:hypothetical protein
MFNTIVGAGAVGAGAGAGSDKMMRLLSAPAPQHWLSYYDNDIVKN